jgi:hypothetical protein
MIPIIAGLLTLGAALLVVRLIDWRVGYSRFLNAHVRTAVGAALITHNGKLLLRFLPSGPFRNFWFLPAAYLHKEKRDSSTLDTARRKIQEINEDLVITSNKKVTSKRGKLARLDTISYALQLGLVPTVVDIFEFKVPNVDLIQEDQTTRWCGNENMNQFEGQLHPLVPEIMKLYFEIVPSVSVEKVEDDSKKVFSKEPERVKETKPVDEMNSQILNGGSIVM